MALAVLPIVAALAIVLHVYVEVTSRFEGTLWELPSRVYSDRLVLRPGEPATVESVASRLERAGYVATRESPRRPGEYRRRGDVVDVYRRAFEDPAGEYPARRMILRFRGSRVASIREARGARLSRTVLEPVLLATVFGARQEEREIVELKAVPDHLVQAVLAAEDARFYTHSGLDPRGIVRALLANLRSGRIVQGGSTITQQTVKNLYLGQEQTWWRKAREAVMALVLDARYAKDRILEVYLNEVYFGQRGAVAVCGVRAAARFYLGEDLAGLSLADAALLAGLIRSPGSYNPFVDPDRALARRDQVLDAMVRLEYVEESEAARARAQELRLAARADAPSYRAPWIVDLVRNRLEARIPAGALSRRGLRIHTTVDPFLQRSAEEAVAEGLRRIEQTAWKVRRRKDEHTLEGLLVALRPATGEILAMVGGRDYGRSQFNRAVLAERQPGSCFKPFVYLAGFEAAVGGARALTPATLLRDEPFSLTQAGNTWRPVNYDGKFRGAVTARVALEDSLNVPTVRAGLRAGLDRVAEVALRCGFDRRFRSLPSLALGAQEVTPLELATAYATLFNGGRRPDPWLIRQVADDEDGVVERGEPRVEPAVSPQAAYLVTDILIGVIRRGTGESSARLGFRGTAAGKTGTTDGTRDAWFVGSTPDLLALVWVGYDDNATTGLSGATGALPIWVEFMKRAGREESNESFPVPDGLAWRPVDPETGMLAQRGCPRSVLEVFVEGTEPRRRCDEHGPGLFRRLFGRARGGA